MRVGWALAAALLFLWAATGAAHGSRPIDDAPGHLHRAGEAFRAGRLSEALDEARRAASAAPLSAEALLTYGQIAEYMGEFEEAQEAYAEAEAVAPDEPPVVRSMASFAARVGEYDRALDLLDRLVAAHWWWERWLSRLLHLSPGLEQIVQLKIDILMEQGDLEGARKVAWEYGIVRARWNYCHEARERTADQSREAVFQAFRLAVLAQPGAADCLRWYGQWLTDEGFVRLGRVMV
ncbi:MAG: tetratricopeptide repeat protein, partial [Candidatus Methylomirabilia bacterium]